MKTHLVKITANAIRAGLAVLAAATACLAIAVSPAQAVTAPASGTPGQVTFTTTVSALHTFPYSPSMIMGASTVYRSPAYAGTQTVTATYAIFSNAGGRWGASRTSTRFVQVAPGYSANFPALRFDGLFTLPGYKAMIVIEWKNPFGSLLGRRVINYDGNLDYRCYSNDPMWAKCTVYNLNDGWGAFVGFG